MTTPEQFELYRNEVLRWMDKYNLNDWQAYFVHERLDESIAECRTNYRGRVVTFALDSDGFEDTLSNYEISKTAYHEVLELLLAELEWVCLYSKAEGETLRTMNFSARHAIIRRLENVQFGQSLWR